MTAPKTAARKGALPPAIVGPLFTVTAAAEYCGVTHVTIYRWIDRGILPAVRLGPRVVRVRYEDLQALCQPMGGGASDADVA